MSWDIRRRDRVAVVTMTTNLVNAQNRAFFADLHEAFDTLERDHASSPVVLTGSGTRFSAGLDLGSTSRCSQVIARPSRRGSSNIEPRTCACLPIHARWWRRSTGTPSRAA